jgi:Uma2 family endonuclease
MVARAPRIEIDERDAQQDQHVILGGMQWSDYEAMLAMRGDQAGVRIYYLDGAIELVSPAWTHEYRKKLLARLLEHWAFEADINLTGVGSWTLKNAPREAGAEPDECYLVNDDDGEVPHLVIEVEWSRATKLAKHEIYRRLGVRELWTLKADRKLVICVLEKERFVERKRSKVLPKLDVAWLLSFAEIEPQSRAVRALADAMREKRR